MTFSDQASKVATAFDNEWDVVSRLAAAHPKTAIIVSLVIGVVLDHFVIRLVW